MTASWRVGMQPESRFDLDRIGTLSCLKMFQGCREDLPSSEPAVVRSHEWADDGLAQTKANPPLLVMPEWTLGGLCHQGLLPQRIVLEHRPHYTY